METEQVSFKRWLSNYLAGTIQPKFAVTSGIVFSLDGTGAEESDLILYDRLHTPNLKAGTAQLIPAETTGVVIQVLDVLTERLLIEEAQHLRAVRRVPKLTQKGFTGGLDLMTPHPYTMGMIVVRSSEMTLEQIRLCLAELQDGWPTTERISAVVVLGVGVVLYETKETGEVRFFPVESSSLTALATEENTLAFLLLWITSYLNTIEIIPPNLISLYAKLGKS